MINAAIVGLGWWGKTLVESAQGSDAIRFVAVGTRAVSPEIKTCADDQKLRVVEGFEALLTDKKLDAIVLATPHSIHARQVIAAAQAGKHVFCEKPFALTKNDAEAAVDATRRAGVTLGLGYNRRFHPEMTKLRERIQSGGLGTVTVRVGKIATRTRTKVVQVRKTCAIGVYTEDPDSRRAI